MVPYSVEMSSSFCWFSCFVGLQILHIARVFQVQKGRHFV